MIDAPWTIRQLSEGDDAWLRALNAMFARAFDDAPSYEAAPPDAAYVRRLLASDTFVALVAHAGDIVLGGLAAYVLPKFEQARSEVYLYDLAVAQTYRRRGIATALIAALRSIAAARGAWVVYVQADYEDDAAVALYSGLGRREDVMHFDLDVDASDAPDAPVPTDHQ